MDNDKKTTIKIFQALVRAKIEAINSLVLAAQRVTGERDMTADFIWGNCSLDQLVEALENDKTN